MTQERNDGEGPLSESSNGSATGSGQAGGGPTPSDRAAPGGSSGTGGYGKAQNQQFHQGQQEQRSTAEEGDRRQSRGERFDEAQGGGRSADTVGATGGEFAEDQAEHQDRGQSVAEEETDAS